MNVKNKDIDIKQAVILAGGSGVRLRPLTLDMPKPLASVCGVPFLDYLIQSIAEVGIDKILLLVGYKNEMIIQQYGDSLPNGIKIEYSIGTVEDETGRRLLNAYDLLDEHFLLMYGDNYWPINLPEIKEVYIRSNVKMLTTVFGNNNGTGEYGFENNIEVGEDCIVRNYDKSRKSEGLNGVDIGYFIVRKESLDPTLKGNISFEKDIFAIMVQEQEVAAHVTNTQYYYITDINSLKNFESFATENNIQRIYW